MNNMEFKSLEELYKRIRPALYSKVIELKRKGKDYIKEEDVWNYLIKNVWNERVNLTLAEMTSDILNLEDDVIISYVMEFLKTSDRNIETREDGLL